MNLTEGIIQHAAKAVKKVMDLSTTKELKSRSTNHSNASTWLMQSKITGALTSGKTWLWMTQSNRWKPVENYEVGHIINAFFEEFVEETWFNQLSLVTHCVSIIKKNPEDPRFTDRFESSFIMTKNCTEMPSPNWTTQSINYRFSTMLLKNSAQIRYATNRWTPESVSTVSCFSLIRSKHPWCLVVPQRWNKKFII